MDSLNKLGSFSKVILKGFLLSGAIIASANTPYFFSRVLPKIIRYFSESYNFNQKEKKKFYNAFYRLKNRELINFEERGKQIYISLTKKGKKEAGKYQIDDLKIKKSRKWNKKWWILIFDIRDKQKIKREALRGKIKELGLLQLQKSVWIYPYKFQKEMNMLRSFFGLNGDEMKIIIASDIENDKKAKNFFNLR